MLGSSVSAWTVAMRIVNGQNALAGSGRCLFVCSRHGHGVAVYLNGDVYHGQFLEDVVGRASELRFIRRCLRMDGLGWLRSEAVQAGIGVWHAELCACKLDWSRSTDSGRGPVSGRYFLTLCVRMRLYGVGSTTTCFIRSRCASWPCQADV